MRDHVDRFDRIVWPVGEGDSDNVRLLSLGLGPTFPVEWEREQNIALCLLRVVEESLDARPIRSLPESVDELEDVAPFALLLEPVGVIEAAAFVVERLDKEAEPLSVSPGLEICGEESNRVCLRLRRCRARITASADEQIDGLSEIGPRRKGERHELRIYELWIQRQPRTQPVAIRIQLSDDVRSVLENRHVGAVAAPEERHERGVLLQHRESVQP